MSGRRKNQLVRARNRPGLEHALRPNRVVAVNQLRIGTVGVLGPEAEKVTVEAVDVIPPGIQDPPVTCHRRRPFKILKRRNGTPITPIGVYRVQREHGYRPMVAAAAADEAVGAGLSRRHPRTVLARLQRRALARGQQYDPTIRQVAGIKVVVSTAGQLPQSAAVNVHLEDVVERVLRQILLVRLVRDVRQIRIVPTVGEQYLAAIVGQVRSEEAARRPVGGEALDRRIAAAKSLQQIDSAPRLRPPAVMLVGNVRKQGRRAFDKQDRIEIQQRVLQRQGANLLLGLKVHLPSRIGIGIRNELFSARPDRLQLGPLCRRIQPVLL